jgi:F0F1-type ATP synthase alpha subunit
MIPIGRGQRKLIIGAGDRKSSIAGDTLSAKFYDKGNRFIVFM